MDEAGVCALVPALRDAGELAIDHGRAPARAAIAAAIDAVADFLEPGDRELLVFASDLALWPGRTTAADHGPLAAAGFDSLAIHDITQVVCLFSWMNRLADGLGVHVEPRRYAWARTLVGAEALERYLAWGGG